MYGRENKLSKPKTQKQSEGNIIKSIRNLFILKIGNKEIKDRIIRDIMTFFEQEDEYYKCDIVDKLFKSLLSNYQSNLETSMRGSNFIFDSMQILYYKYHKVNFSCDGSYIDSPDWIKKKKATINPKNKYDKCF